MNPALVCLKRILGENVEMKDLRVAASALKNPAWQRCDVVPHIPSPCFQMLAGI